MLCSLNDFYWFAATLATGSHTTPDLLNLNEHILLHVAVNMTRYGLKQFLTKNNSFKLLSLIAIWVLSGHEAFFGKLDNLRCTYNNDDIKQWSMSLIGLNRFTLRSDQYMNSPYDFNTLTKRQVIRIFKNGWLGGFCLDTTPNSQEYATTYVWSSVRRISFQILRVKGLNARLFHVSKIQLQSHKFWN